VKSLEALSRALSGEVLDLRLARCRAVDSRTLAGHARNLLGYMLSAYCLFKCAILVATPMSHNSLSHAAPADLLASRQASAQQSCGCCELILATGRRCVDQAESHCCTECMICWQSSSRTPRVSVALVSAATGWMTLLVARPQDVHGAAGADVRGGLHVGPGQPGAGLRAALLQPRPPGDQRPARVPGARQRLVY